MSNHTAPSATLWAKASKDWVIAPKVKPGRKPKRERPPAEEDLADGLDSTGRRNQNRAAQRAFRERKQSQLAELQARIQQYEQGEIERVVAVQNIAKRLKEENESLRRENIALQSKISELERGKPLNNQKKRRDNSVFDDEPIRKKAKLDESRTSYSPAAASSSSGTSESARSPISTPPAEPPSNSPDIYAFPDPFAIGSDGTFDCGLCSQNTPCACRELALHNSSLAMKEVEYGIGLPVDTGLIAAPRVSILDNPPAYQPPIPLRRRTEHSKINSLFPIVDKSTPTCSGDPSNCMACADDSFGKAFCVALARSESCSYCLFPQDCGSQEGSVTGNASFEVYGGRKEDPNLRNDSRTIPTDDAWRQLKSHPNVSFADLTLLAEVVARKSKCTGPRVELSPPPTAITDIPSSPITTPAGQPTDKVENIKQSERLQLVPHEVLVRCGRQRMREVDADGVRDALRLLDAKFSQSM